MDDPKKVYLGDGLYATDDGFQFWLTAPRLGGHHEVALDLNTLDAFFRFIERSRGVTITVSDEIDPI